jgi:branched-chain amino acid transport system substrate-binding protein
MRTISGLVTLWALALLTFPEPSPAAEMRGVTATEIRIGQTMPYSGPVSAFGALGKGEVGYFKMVNERGGINGRKVNLISLDDGYAPPKTVEQTRRLVESDEVALIFSSIGTAHNTAIAKYLQGKTSRNCSSAPAPRNSPTSRNIRRRPWACRDRSATRRGCMRVMRWRRIRTRSLP